MAYIGKDSLRKRIRLVQEELEETKKAGLPLEAVLADCRRISGLEALKGPAEEYMQWLEEIKAWKKKESEKKQLSRRLEAVSYTHLANKGKFRLIRSRGQKTAAFFSRRCLRTAR